MYMTANSANKPLNVKELADFMGVHERTIYQMLSRKMIPAFKFGGQWRFDPDAVRNWIADRMTCGRPEMVS